MEAAKPIFIESSKEIESNMKIIDLKTFDINLNNKKYLFEFGKSEDKKYIIFKMSENVKNLIDLFYLSFLDNNDFYSLNILFKLYQNIDEIYNFLLDIIINKKYSLIFKNNLIVLTLQIPMPGGKIIEINFDLKEKKIGQKNIMKKLYSKVEELIKENQLIKTELNNKNYEIENLKNNFKIIKDENIEIKNKLKNIEDLLLKSQKINIDENNISFFNESIILKNNQEKNKLLEWISTNGKIREITLLYKATRDGDEGRTFYTKCVNKGPTISLIKTKKGRRFGGFTMVEWINKFQILKDNNAFLFSLDNMNKYKILKSKLAIGCDPYNYLLIYGNDHDGKGLFLFSGFLSRKNKENNSTRVYDVPSNYCLSGEEEFYVEEVEVYQIRF